jgi:hypothetical protein
MVFLLNHSTEATTGEVKTAMISLRESVQVLINTMAIRALITTAMGFMVLTLSLETTTKKNYVAVLSNMVSSPLEIQLEPISKSTLLI